MKMASTTTQTTITSSQNSTQSVAEPSTEASTDLEIGSSIVVETTTEPPAKKQKSIEAKSVLDIQKILECPVCLKTPDRPDDVHFCSNGHLLCDGCYTNILDKKCPVCRSEDWNGQYHSLLKQIMSALPKLCPLGCEIQIESNDMNNHMKNCHYRLIDCISICKCPTKNITFKDSLVNHLKNHHQGTLDSNKNGHFQYNLKIQESHFDINKNKNNASWTPKVVEFDSQIFIARCYRRRKLLYLQVFIHENQEIAEKYSCKITMANTENFNCNVTHCGEVISVDVPQADYQREDHSGTLSFTKAMLRKLIINNGTLNIDITITKKNVK